MLKIQLTAMLLVGMNFTSQDLFAQKATTTKKATVTTPQKNKEQILNWLCQKIEENGSGYSNDGGGTTFIGNGRTVTSCKYQNGNIVIKQYRTYEYNDALDSLGKPWERHPGHYIHRRFNYNRTYIIPFSELKNIYIKIKDKNTVRDHDAIEFEVKGRSIIGKDEPAENYLDDSTNPIYINDSRERCRQEAMKENNYSWYSCGIMIDFSQDPTLQNRMQKAIDDLKKYFNTQELY